MLMCRNVAILIVGSPIETLQSDNPEQSVIDAVHKRYMDSLTDLFNQYKVQFGVDADKTLNFV